MKPTADELLQQLRTLAHIPHPDAAQALARVFVQLDDIMTEGGIPPRHWWPPLQHDYHNQQLISERRALHRLEAVLERAILDDERADRATSVEAAASSARCPTCDSPAAGMHPAVSGGGEVTRRCPDVFHRAILRDYLVRLLSRAVVDELHREQAEMRALLARMAREQTLRIQEQVAELERQPPTVRMVVDDHGKFWVAPLTEQPPLPESLRRPQT
jgi:hypothetical protein